jgi:hypothetical protein
MTDKGTMTTKHHHHKMNHAKTDGSGTMAPAGASSSGGK